MRILTERRTILILTIMAVYLFFGLVFGSPGDTGIDPAAADSVAHEDSGHGGPVLGILLGLIVILLVAKLGGDVFERFGQPVEVLKQDGFKIDRELYIELEGSTPTTMAKSLGFAMIEFAGEFHCRLKTLNGQSELFEIVDARYPTRSFPCGLNRRQQHRQKDADNRDHHK